jgi:predicted peroxiredoxin
MRVGEVLEIATDIYDPVANDIRAWCRMTGHNLLQTEEVSGYRRYYIEKTEPEDRGHRLALVVSNKGLEQLLSPLGFALGAAITGTDVHIYFQGPAVRVLKRNFKEKLQGASRPFSAFARKGLAKVGHVSPQEKLKQLRELGARFYVCGPSMDHFGVKQSELIFGDVVLAEYITFIEAMEQADIHIYV